jgi:single-strand DNA-binding protein
MQDTNITVVGNAVDDAQLRFTPGGAAVANFRIASTPRRFNRQTNEWEDQDALFLTVTCWKQHAENVAETVKRGMRLVVTGNLVQRQFERNDGTKGSSYEIAEAEVAVSLRSATAVVTKVTAQGQPAQQQSTGGGWGQQPATDPWASQGGSNDRAPF